jgi:hypothetical protein
VHICCERTWASQHMRENYQNSHLISPFSPQKSSTGAFYARLGCICQHLIDSYATHAPVAILVTNLLIARLICGHIAWTLLVQVFHAKTKGYQVPKVCTLLSILWVHVRFFGAARRSNRHIFGVGGIATYSPICGGAIEVAHTPRGARQEALDNFPSSYGSYLSCWTTAERAGGAVGSYGPSRSVLYSLFRVTPQDPMWAIKPIPGAATPAQSDP